MYIYLTSGTGDFMEKVAKKYPNEQIIVLHGNSNSVLLHETEKKSVFSAPRKYEVIDGTGSFEQRGFYAFHNVSLADETKDMFEQNWLQQSTQLKNNSALIAYRFLKPKQNGAYIIITHWAGPASYEVWTNTESYKEQIAPLFEKTSSVVNDLFNVASYISLYSAAKMEE